MRSRLWQVVQWTLGLLIVAFVVRHVVVNWDQVRQADLAWSISPLVLGAAVLVVWLVFAGLAEAWRRMVAGWGSRLGFWEGARIWLLSSMAKYVPGKVWALAGMALMAERRGVPAWVATSSAVLLQVLSIGTGALLVAGGGLTVLRPGSLPGTAVLIAVAAAAAALIGLTLWPPMTRRLVRLVVPGAEVRQIPGAGTIAFGGVVNLTAWVGYGLSFWLFARGTLPEAPLTLGESVSAYTASYIAGAIAPFAPGGLGVRESVLVLILQDRTGLANALALAAVARIGMTLAEVVAALPFLRRTEERTRD